MTIAAPLLMIFPFLMVYAAVSDTLTMTISNKVPLILAGAFLVVAVALALPVSAIGLHLLVGIAILAVTFGCFAAGWMGGGDAKLMAASALWFGPTADLLAYLVTGAIYGGILTIGLVVARNWLAPVTGVNFLDRLLHPKTGIPYGIALGIAGMTTFAESRWMEIMLSGLR